MLPLPPPVIFEICADALALCVEAGDFVPVKVDGFPIARLRGRQVEVGAEEVACEIPACHCMDLGALSIPPCIFAGFIQLTVSALCMTLPPLSKYCWL